jgi:hypothetical protein
MKRRRLLPSLPRLTGPLATALRAVGARRVGFFVGAPLVFALVDATFFLGERAGAVRAFFRLDTDGALLRGPLRLGAPGEALERAKTESHQHRSSAEPQGLIQQQLGDPIPLWEREPGFFVSSL